MDLEAMQCDLTDPQLFVHHVTSF